MHIVCQAHHRVVKGANNQEQYHLDCDTEDELTTSGR
jgi:hypothetical protein